MNYETRTDHCRVKYSIPLLQWSADVIGRYRAGLDEPTEFNEPAAYVETQWRYQFPPFDAQSKRPREDAFSRVHTDARVWQ
jgi:hypothetical protein